MLRRLLPPALLLTLLGGGLAAAQTGADVLALAKAQATEAAERARQLRAAADKATDEAARAGAEAEALVADIQQVEADITAAQVRIGMIEALQARQSARLAERQRPVIRLTAALQTMARRPPALALVQPGSVDDLVRVRALLASTLPAIRERTAGLRAEAAAGDRLRTQAEAAAAQLATSRGALRDKRIALAQLEQSQRARAGALVQSALFQSDRSLALTEEARELADRMDSRQYRAETRERLAALPGPIPRPAAASAPASAGAASYQIPVEGRLLRGMGEISGAGVHARGLTFETAANAAVVAPRAGRIAYAGRFRSYGEVVIIDHGGGWTSTVTGLRALRVRQGETVEAGDPIGRAGNRVGVELRRAGRPYPIARLIGAG